MEGFIKSGSPIPELTPDRRDLLREFARNLCAASIAYRLGIGLGHALKAHVKDEVGDYWYHVANALQEDHMRAMNRIGDTSEDVSPTQ